MFVVLKLCERNKMLKTRDISGADPEILTGGPERSLRPPNALGAEGPGV